MVLVSRSCMFVSRTQLKWAFLYLSDRVPSPEDVGEEDHPGTREPPYSQLALPITTNSNK